MPVGKVLDHPGVLQAIEFCEGGGGWDCMVGIARRGRRLVTKNGGERPKIFSRWAQRS